MKFVFSFFLCLGDLGGYYGLFLGGSAISLFEILDLIVYNAIIKVATRRLSNRRSRIEPSPQNRVIHVKHVAESVNDYELDVGIN
jgi:hypothetical protein